MKTKNRPRYFGWLRAAGILVLFGLLLHPLDGTGNVLAQKVEADMQSRPLTSVVNAPANPYWYGFASGNDVRSNLWFDGEYVWSGSGGGIVRWEKATGAYEMFLPSNGLITYAGDSIVQDNNGDLWFGTYSGISRYNGRDWISYSPYEIGFSSVWRSTIDPSGNLWFGGYRSGLSKFDGTRWTRYSSIETGMQSKNVNALDADSQGNIWAATSSSGVEEIHKFDGAAWTTIPSADIPDCGNNIEMIAVAPNDDLWVACDSSIAMLRGSTWASYLATDGVTFEPNSFAFAQDGTVFAGGYGVYRLDAMGNFVPVFTGFEMGGYNNSLAVDADGNIWAGTKMGLRVFDGFRTISYTTDHHPSSNGHDAMAFDTRGSFWMVGDGGQNGINQFDGTTWITHCPFDGGAAQDCLGSHDIAADGLGNVWAAGQGLWNEGSKLAKFDGVSWQIVVTTEINTGDFYVVAVDDSNDVWAATGRKLFRYHGGTWSSFEVPGTDHHAWREMAIQGSDVWLVDSTGVFLWDGASWRQYTTADGLPSVEIRGIAVSSSEVWVATSAGAARFKDNTWTAFTESNGLPENEVLDVAFSTDGVLWAGFDNWAELAYYDGSAWVRRFSSNYLVNGQADVLLFAPDGNLWIANGSFGIRVYNPQGLVNTQPVPTGGGTETSINGDASLTIAPDSLDEPVLVTIQSVQPVVTTGLVSVGMTYQFSAVSASTGDPITLGQGETFTLSIQYNPSGLDPAVEQGLGLYYWDGDSWEFEPSSVVDIANHMVTATPNHLSQWAVMRKNRVFIPFIKK